MSAINWIEAPVQRVCPLCGEIASRVVSRTMQHRLNLTTVICQHCSLVYSNPLPREDVYNRFYTEVYATYYGKIAQAADMDNESPYIRFVLDLIEVEHPLNGAHVLELGPGRGVFLHWARRRGANPLGVEPSREFHEFLIRSGLPSVNKALEDLTDIGVFDVIAMFHVLEHFYDPNIALQRCRTLLRDGGCMAIIVPDITAPYRSLDHYFLRYVHPTSFSPATLQALLDKHGFDLVQRTTQGGKWYEPRNIFVIARKRPNITPSFALPTQTAAEIIAKLNAYRWHWRFFLGPRWHLWLYNRKVLRFVRRCLRLIKRLLMDKRIRRRLTQEE